MRRNYLLSVYVDKDTYELLQEIAQREERSISYLVRKMIKEYLEKRDKSEENEVKIREEVK
ncbi:MAG: ribbon-helix-helix protein, CopG family, partial [Thermofilaceae archaeon]